MKESQVQLGGTYLHGDRPFRVLSLHSDQAYGMYEGTSIYTYVRYDQLKLKGTRNATE